MNKAPAGILKALDLCRGILIETQLRPETEVNIPEQHVRICGYYGQA
jgi:hypothetical protein